MSHKLTLYIRHGCHLCEDMEHHLLRLQEALDLSWSTVDIDADKDLFQRYNDKVPVLTGLDQEICHYFLDEVALRHYLDSTASL